MLDLLAGQSAQRRLQLCGIEPLQDLAQPVAGGARFHRLPNASLRDCQCACRNCSILRYDVARRHRQHAVQQHVRQVVALALRSARIAHLRQACSAMTSSSRSICFGQSRSLPQVSISSERPWPAGRVVEPLANPGRTNPGLVRSTSYRPTRTTLTYLEQCAAGHQRWHRGPRRPGYRRPATSWSGAPSTA